MPRTRGPGNLVAHRPTTAARTDAAAHQSYAAMIDRDLGGRRATSYRAIDDGRPPSTLALMVRPLALFLFACLAFVVVLLLWLWQAGFLERLRPAPRPVPAPSTSWMGARQAASPAVRSDAPPQPAPVAKSLPAPAPSEPVEDTEAQAAEADDHVAE